jgi:hypothetical protein
VIRQAISCDICGTEKKQTNHWFVACEQAGELRVSGWNSRNRLRQGSKHLCGQTCLHKLVDDFMARALQVRVHAAAEVDEMEEEALSTETRSAQVIDASLTSRGARVERDARVEDESSARLLPAPAPVAPVPAQPKRIPFRAQPELVPMPARRAVQNDDSGLAGSPVNDESPRYASRSWHAEAWDREREREQRAAERYRDAANQRRSTA